jgi:hypothetical protein
MNSLFYLPLFVHRLILVGDHHLQGHSHETPCEIIALNYNLDQN